MGHVRAPPVQREQELRRFAAPQPARKILSDADDSDAALRIDVAAHLPFVGDRVEPDERRRIPETFDQRRRIRPRIPVQNPDRDVLHLKRRGEGKEKNLQDRRNDDDDPRLAVAQNNLQLLDDERSDPVPHINRSFCAP